MEAWRNWLHCTGSTYGTWPRGDPRGWRARHHREHVEGDYRDPPPEGTYDELLARSKRLMKGAGVLLAPEARAFACRAIAQALRHHKVELVDVCVGAVHFHILARFTPLPGPGPQAQARPSAGPQAQALEGLGFEGPGFEALKREARRLVGIAKWRSARDLCDAGLARPGGVWAARCGVRPIRGRAHQLRVARYIRSHAARGAAVWSLMRNTEP